MRRAFCIAALALSSCVETGQDRVSIPLYLAGTEPDGPIEAAGGARVELDRADLAFGPLYFCAGTTAGELCETARLEWLGSAVVDALSDRPARAGELEGTSGPIRSWMYDLGISSQLTRAEPYPLEAARALSNASLVLEGRALVPLEGGGERELPFFASLALAQTEDTELGVPVLRSSRDDRFEREIEPGSVSGLVVRFDPAPWLSNVDFSAYLEDGGCARGEQGEACAERVIIKEGSQAWRALRNALAAGTRPAFEWGAPAPRP